ncbi:MAG: cyclic nucleotide-binding domain-containing protein [Magnetococcales bacterium]|nr:zinc-ribbon domain-containing protein [Magnetococcales bacterium]NGZ28783.1 cyclic nucleotide-binding domain-containing protein [Magnetococcales bacterium]
MIVLCTQCKSSFEIDERKLGQGSRKMRCSFCHNVFYVSAPSKPPLGNTPDLIGEEEEEENAELMGTMILSLSNKPKHGSDPKKKDDEAPIEAVNQPVKGQLKRVILSPGKKAELLYQSRWLETMDWSHIKILAPYWELYKIAPGTSLFQMGDHNHNLGLVLRGEISLSYDDGDSYDQNFATIGPGKSLGELSLLDEKPRACDALAMVETYLFVLTKKRLDLLGENHPDTQRQLLLLIARRMCRKIRESGGYQVDYLLN